MRNPVFAVVVGAGARAATTLPAGATGPAGLRAQASVFVDTIPEEVTELRGESLSPEQVELGKMLFFEPRLSASHIITCHTCHSLATGGADNVPVSIGHGWQKGPRNSPTVLNAVFNAADRKSTRLNSSHVAISYAVFCLQKKMQRAGAPA